MDRLDMSLDDIVQESRKAKKLSRGTGAAKVDVNVRQAGVRASAIQGSEDTAPPEKAGRSSDDQSAAGPRRRGPRRRGDSFPGGRQSRGRNLGDKEQRHGPPRRPIVVRDPRDGSTRVVGGGSGSSNAPISRIINGYGGRRIVVRDPSAVRRTDRQNIERAEGNAVSPGVRRGYISKRGSSLRHRLSSRENNVGSILPEPKIIVQNLDPGVNDGDINELFTNIGPLEEAFIVYDNSGRHTGSAEVTFARMDDALSAIKRYNNVPLDSRPLRISLSENLAPSRPSHAHPDRGFELGGASNPKLESW